MNLDLFLNIFTLGWLAREKGLRMGEARLEFLQSLKKPTEFSCDKCGEPVKDEPGLCRYCA